MLYHLEPDPSLTGGAWYNGQDFDFDFVEKLTAFCHDCLRERKKEAKKGDPSLINNNLYASLTEVCDFINKCGISTVSSY